jgi:hypothetical protein
MFSLDLLSNEGGKKNFDSDKIKEYYKMAIYTALTADILTLGQNNTGSFSLGVIKNSLTGTAAESMLKSTADVLTNDLLVQTFELNGWDTARIGKFDFDNMDNTDLETYSKSMMRYSSTGLLELDREVLNAVRVSIGVDPLPEDKPVQTDILTGNTSRSGDGSAAGGANGTSQGVASTDTSNANLENVG